MRVFTGFDSLPPLRHATVTVGSFDGVHAGHRILLDALRRRAAERQGESVVVTFAPHPRLVLEPDCDLRLLSTPEEKIRLLDEAGVDNLIIAPFTREFSRTSSYEFIRRDLIGRIGAQTLVVGYNHHFGRDKQGDYDYLESLRREFGIEVYRVPRYDAGADKVSSTTLRELIGRGEMARAAQLLGAPYPLIGRRTSDGRILAGDDRKLLPPEGDYRVMIGARSTVAHIDAEGAVHLPEEFRKNDPIIKFTDKC